ncbi:hypothetical protein D3C87_1707170 [compost metagenome]
MGDQHDIAASGALELGHDHLADLLRRVFHPVDLGRLDQFGVAAECGQPVPDQRGDAVEALDVLAAGFDRHQVLERGDQRGLLLLGQLVGRLHRGGVGGGGAGGGECQREREGAQGREAGATNGWHAVRFLVMAMWDRKS